MPSEKKRKLKNEAAKTKDLPVQCEIVGFSSFTLEGMKYDKVSLQSKGNVNFIAVCVAIHNLGDGEVIPAEVGACKFSFSNGMVSTYHKILPGYIPPGSKGEALNHSKKTHNLPLDLPNFLRELAIPFEAEFENFISEDVSEENITLYTQDKYHKTVAPLINTFVVKKIIQISSLDALFECVYSATVKPITMSRVEDIINCNQYKSNTDLACMWHRSVAPYASNHCALTIVRRWVYNILTAISLKEYGVTLTEGKLLLSEKTMEFLTVQLDDMKLKEKDQLKKKKKAQKATKNQEAAAAAVSATSPQGSSSSTVGSVNINPTRDVNPAGGAKPKNPNRMRNRS